MPIANAGPIGALLGAAVLTAALAAGPAAATTSPDTPTHKAWASGAPSPASSASPSRDTAGKSAPARYSKNLAERMNAVRRKHDLRSIRVVDCLNGFAGSWARRLARTGDFYHQDLGPIMRRCNLSSAGEIIAKGAVSPRQMMQMWLGSPGHRELLLEPSFRIAGVAGRRGHGAWVGCIDFGRR